MVLTSQNGVKNRANRKRCLLSHWEKCMVVTKRKKGDLGIVNLIKR